MSMVQERSCSSIGQARRSLLTTRRPAKFALPNCSWPVLGVNNYAYAEASKNQQMDPWVGAHVRTFEFLGGCPQVIVLAFVPGNKIHQHGGVHAAKIGKASTTQVSSVSRSCRCVNSM